jgi:hypothetical protein
MAILRRTWLKGVSLGAGSLLLGPVLNQLRARAEGKDRKPWRVVFVLQANGFQPWAAQPKGLEITPTGPAKTVDLPLEDYELPADLEPVSLYKPQMTIVQRLNGAHTRPCHSAGFGALAGVATRTPSAPTIDAVLASLNPGPFPIVNLGVATDNRKAENGIVKVCSAWGAGKPIGTQLDPNLAYKALFGEAAAKLDEGGKLMDQIADDVARVQAKLSAAERERFAQYLDAFETLDQRKELFRKVDELARRDDEPPKVDDRFSSSAEAKRLAAHFELAATALISGLTNVVTITSGACDTDGHFEGLGVDNQELHEVGHMHATGGKTWQSIYTTLRRYHLQLIAGLVDRLKQVSEPDGTPMMDNTLIVYTSDGADAHHSNGKQWPFVLIGNLGGKLRSGRFVEYPAFGQAGNRSINALYATLLHAAGHARDGFNHAEKAPKEDHGPLAELLS